MKSSDNFGIKPPAPVNPGDPVKAADWNQLTESVRTMQIPRMNEAPWKYSYRGPFACRRSAATKIIVGEGLIQTGFDGLAYAETEFTHSGGVGDWGLVMEITVDVEVGTVDAPSLAAVLWSTVEAGYQSTGGDSLRIVLCRFTADASSNIIVLTQRWYNGDIYGYTTRLRTGIEAGGYNYYLGLGGANTTTVYADHTHEVVGSTAIAVPY